jgi:phosphoglucosamine mutase
MSRKYFGTDGIRGLVGKFPITADFAMRLGYAAGSILATTHRASHTHAAVLIGKDTRISGYMLESALQAGLSSAGVDVYLAGPMPTPGVAYLTRALRLSAGIVISASHNPYYDNGIKFFGANGEKLSDEIELAIETLIDAEQPCVSPDQLGKTRRVEDAAGRYIEFCKSTFPNELDLKGVKVVIDCAHGATYQIAPHVFHELGADVIAMGNQPNGLNINEACGATHPQALVQRMLVENAEVGIALDGDGDRVILVDQQGQIYDGDVLLYLIARFRQQQGTLGEGVVGTLMTNYGVEKALTKAGIKFIRAKVGDRYVLEALKQQGWLLGGEGSGHLLTLDKHTTGDGIVSALQVLHALKQAQQSLKEACSKLDLSTQVLINVPIAKQFAWQEASVIKPMLAEAEQALGEKGRVLLRASGTEPLIRIMVEHSEPEIAQKWAAKLAEVVKSAADC